jgi:hypothetical protein
MKGIKQFFSGAVTKAAAFITAIMDARNEFCDAVACNTGGVASYLVGNVIDLGTAARDIGNGMPLYLIISVDMAIASATGSLVFHLCSDAQAAIAVDGSATYHVSTGAFLEGAMTAGTRLICVALPQGRAYERYLGIVQETITAAMTAGKINAYLTSDPQGWKAYPDALT